LSIKKAPERACFISFGVFGSQCGLNLVS